MVDDDAAVDAITKSVYSIIHGLTSCTIGYRQWLALQLVPSNMG